MPLDPLEISCGRCDAPDEKFAIPEDPEEGQSSVDQNIPEASKTHESQVTSQSGITEEVASDKETTDANENNGAEQSNVQEAHQSSAKTDSSKKSQSQDISTTDSDFPEDIFAPDISSTTEEGTKEPVLTNPTTSLSDALHAASDALLEN